MSTAALLVPAPTASAHEGHTEVIEEVVAYGRSESRIGTASAASAGWVAADDIRLPPLLRTGELVEAVPGMVATQHSGTGKANQYFLRGFNLDHGTDFSGFLDGMPINLRSHGHGQGYLDLNFLIPEMVSATEFRKGPYRADRGDFSSAGSAEFVYYRELPENLFTVTLGEHGYRRALVAGSKNYDPGTLTAALATTTDDGPWQLDEDLEQHQLHIALSSDPMAPWVARISVDGYHSTWNATDQIPARAVAAGLIRPTGFIDPDLGGETKRWSLNASFAYQSWQVNAYSLHYDFDLYSNFTYLLDDPVDGDEFHQFDRRNVYGLTITHSSDHQLLGRDLSLRVGGEVRYDDVLDVGLEKTVARQRSARIRKDQLSQGSLGTFVEITWRPLPRLRLQTGMRFELMDYDVAARSPANSGDGDDHITSPSVSLAYLVSDSVELYANWGRGFHSNDVRGATVNLDPASGAPTDPVDLFAQSEGAELGLRYERDQRFNLSLNAFWLELDSELVFVGDAGGTEANGSTRRYGVEASAFWQPLSWLAANFDYTRTRARYRADEGEGRFIPGAIATTASLGLFAEWANGVSASARLRYLAEPPLAGDDSVRGDSSTVTNLGIAYRLRNTTLRIDLFNAFDTDASDIAYFYASRLPGEPSTGVEDIHSHPLLPRMVRASVTWSF